MNLSEHFSIEEMTFSEYAIRKGLDNQPNVEELNNLTRLCQYALEPLRELLNKPIKINSGFRSKEVNKGIGGAKNSQHVEGKAADITISGYNVESIFQTCKTSLKYDQLIQEFDSWVHISWNGINNRQQALRAVKENGKTKYIPE